LFGFTVLTPHKSESSIFFCFIFSQTGKASSTLLATSALINGFFAFGDSFLVSLACFSGVFLATGSFGVSLVDCTKGAFVDVVFLFFTKSSNVSRISQEYLFSINFHNHSFQSVDVFFNHSLLATYLITFCFISSIPFHFAIQSSITLDI